jgi:hypothetical protein
MSAEAAGFSSSLLDSQVVLQTLRRLGLDDDAIAEVLSNQGIFHENIPFRKPNSAASLAPPALTPQCSSAVYAAEGCAPAGCDDVHVSPERRGHVERVTYDESFDVCSTRGVEEEEELPGNRNVGGGDAPVESSDLDDLIEQLNRVTEAASNSGIIHTSTTMAKGRKKKPVKQDPADQRAYVSSSTPSAPKLRDARQRLSPACAPFLFPEEFAWQGKMQDCKQKKKKKKKKEVVSAPVEKPKRPDLPCCDPTLHYDEGAKQRNRTELLDQEIRDRVAALCRSGATLAGDVKPIFGLLRHKAQVEQWLHKHSPIPCAPLPFATCFPARIDRPDIVAHSSRVGTIMTSAVKRHHGEYLGVVLGNASSRFSNNRALSAPPPGRKGRTIAGGPKYEQPTYAYALHRPGGLPTTLPRAQRCDAVSRANEYAVTWRHCRILANLQKRTADSWAARFALLDTR